MTRWITAFLTSQRMYHTVIQGIVMMSMLTNPVTTPRQMKTQPLPTKDALESCLDYLSACDEVVDTPSVLSENK